MIRTLALLAIFMVAQPVYGQCCGTNSYYSNNSNTIYLDLINTGDFEYKRFYVTAYLERYNYRLSIPVINNYLPSIEAKKDSNGRIYKFVLDYSKRHRYSSFYGKVVTYPRSSSKVALKNDPKSSVTAKGSKPALKFNTKTKTSVKSNIDVLLDELDGKETKYDSRPYDDGKMVKPSKIPMPKPGAVRFPRYDR